MGPRLLIVLSDELSPLVEKGEVIDRYYNPSDFFSEIHFLLLNDDNPDIYEIGRMSGTAEVFIHNYQMPNRLNLKSLGWNYFLVSLFLRKIHPIVRSISPDVVRTFGLSVELVVAGMVKQQIGIPHVASIHTNPDKPSRKVSFVRRLLTFGLNRMRARVLKNADAVLPVYEPAVPFLQSLGIQNFLVCYNVLNPSNVDKKDDYSLDKHPKIVCVSRQFETKDPSNLIKAVSRLENGHLTLIGDGSLHQGLRELVKDLGIEERVEFIPALENDVLCRKLPEFDIFAAHSDHWEISKAVLEALLSGLPVVINRLPDYQIPELSDDLCVLVENSEEGYLDALKRLTGDRSERERLGRNAARAAWQRWDPRETEAVYRDIYKRLLGQ